MTGSLTRRFRRAGRELVQQVKDVSGTVLSQATEAIAREVESEGLSPQRLGRKIKRVASHVRDALVDAATGAVVDE